MFAARFRSFFSVVWRSTSILLSLVVTGSIVLCLLLPVSLLAAEVPTAEKPRVFIDTTYRHPSGPTLFVAKGGDLQAALDSANPGATIVLQAGAIFTGEFTLPAKSNPNHKWIYIESSAVDSLPQPGTRVSPSDASNMPKIVTATAEPALSIDRNGGYVRFVGIEMYSTSTYLADAKHTPHPINGFSYYLLNGNGVSYVTVDRCYFHGSDTQDVNHAIGFAQNSSYLAAVDSDIRDIHGNTNDSQAFLVHSSPGPVKLVNNYLSASSEDVMFGGGGGYRNPYVPADIEIRANHFYKPESWIPVTTGQEIQWAVKNNFECKACLRLLFEDNVLENVWRSAQTGSNILLTPRPNQSGHNSVVDDLTIQNNVLKNANIGFSTLGYDNACQPPLCTVVGEAKRVIIRNNLILTRDPAAAGSFIPQGFSLGHRTDSWLIQHNTVQGINGSQCWASIYFNNAAAPDHPTNLWILDNAFCQQPTGDGGYQGLRALDKYMPQPPPVGERFAGNAMFVPRDRTSEAFPERNLTTSSPFAFKDHAKGDFALASSKRIRTTDGSPVGVDMSRIQRAGIPPDTAVPARVRPEVAIVRPKETAQFRSVDNASSWHLTPAKGMVTSEGLYTAPATVKEPTGVTLCAGDSEPHDSCASIVLLPSH